MPMLKPDDLTEITPDLVRDLNRETLERLALQVVDLALYYYCVIKWIVEAVAVGADSMGSGEAVGRGRGSDAVARSGSRLAHGVPAAPAPRGRKFAGSVG